MSALAFYAALGVELPDRGNGNVPVRCFAAPEQHRNGDRSPSASINVEDGAWHCHGCGATGGAYDAAIARGVEPRDAMKLLRRHGLRADPPAPGLDPRDGFEEVPPKSRTTTNAQVPPKSHSTSTVITALGRSDDSSWERRRRSGELAAARRLLGA